MLSKRDDGVSFVRVAAMLLIIVSHILSEIPIIKNLAQATNAAVYTFLFISGFLFGPKNINDGLKWFVGRLKIILIPMYIVLAVVVTWMYFNGDYINFIKVAAYLINIQGLWGAFGGVGHMWFLTTIMFCYLITPLLSCIDKELFNYRATILLCLTVFVMVVFSAQLMSVAVAKSIVYVGLYVVAYSVSNFWNREMQNKTFIVISLFVLFFASLRVLSRRYFDGTPLYDGIIVPLSQAVLGCYVFAFLYKIKSFFLEKIKFKKWFLFFDKYTFELYLVHYPLIVGPIFIWGTTKNIIIDILLVFIVSLALAFILKQVSELIMKFSFR